MQESKTSKDTEIGDNKMCVTKGQVLGGKNQSACVVCPWSSPIIFSPPSPMSRGGARAADGCSRGRGRGRGLGRGRGASALASTISERSSPVVSTSSSQAERQLTSSSPPRGHSRGRILSHTATLSSHLHCTPELGSIRTFTWR